MKKLIIFLLLFTAPMFADEHKTHIREGNKLYKQKKYNDAEIEYMKANENKNTNIGEFNIADALYKQGKYKEAAEKFENLTASDLSDDELASIYHNLGNSYLQNKEYEKSIDAYKDALKRNSDDPDSRYNLEYAKQMLQKQQQQQQQNQDQNKDNKNKQDKNKDKQDNKDNKDKNNKDKQDQNKQDKKDDQNKDKQDQNKQNENKDNKDKQDQQQNQQNGDEQKGDKKDQQQAKAQKKPAKISKKDAERMLQALKEHEKKLLKKMKKKEGEANSLEKNW